MFRMYNKRKEKKHYDADEVVQVMVILCAGRQDVFQLYKHSS